MLAVDLSKAEPSRSYRNSMLARYDRTIKCLQEQRDRFISELDQCDIFRKERSAIIEGEIVPKLKSLDIKPSKPLGKFDNQGLIEELTRLITENSDKDTEEIEIAMIKIKNRYRDIVNISKKLETYTRRLENYPDEGYEGKLESDYNDEVTIDLAALESQKKDKVQKENLNITDEEDEELEQVVEIHEAGRELLKSLSNMMGKKEENPNDLEEIQLSDLDDQIAHISESEEFAEQIATLAEELKTDLDETNIVSFLSGNEEQEDYATFTINNNISLQDLVKHVYEENDDQYYESELWTSVYNFSTNKEVIDEVADSLNVSVEEVVKTPGMLNGITLRFPTELVTYEQTKSENITRRAA